jgi:hypothetical protein
VATSCRRRHAYSEDLPADRDPRGGAHAASHEHPPLSLFEREQIGAGEALFYVRGAVFYEDAAGERHHTTFCRVFDLAHGLIEPHRPGYNYGD